MSLPPSEHRAPTPSRPASLGGILSQQAAENRRTQRKIDVGSITALAALPTTLLEAIPGSATGDGPSLSLTYDVPVGGLWHYAFRVMLTATGDGFAQFTGDGSGGLGDIVPAFPIASGASYSFQPTWTSPGGGETTFSIGASPGFTDGRIEVRAWKLGNL